MTDQPEDQPIGTAQNAADAARKKELDAAFTSARGTSRVKIDAYVAYSIEEDSMVGRAEISFGRDEFFVLTTKLGSTKQCWSQIREKVSEILAREPDPSGSLYVKVGN